ncbi:MAG: RNA polymerase sigma factor [Ignavibacteriaceae bacterium]|nr:RNA polymerase sigma factor [Ignavibacteriaceae bacterium]
MSENTKYTIYLIEQAKRGSYSSFMRLVELYLSELYGIVIRLTSNDSLTKIILEKVIIFAAENLQQVRMDGTFSSWLKAITVRQCLNSHYFANPANLPGEGEEYIFSKNLFAEMDFAIMRLPREARYVIVLYDLLKYSSNEVSDMLSIGNPENVKIILKLARKKIIEDIR